MAPTTTAIPTSHAKGRQRGVGNRPSGNQPQEREEADVRDPEPGVDPGHHLTARQRPGARKQRVVGVLAAEQEHPREEAYGAEEPADVVLGGEPGGEHGADRREAYRYHDFFDGLLEGRHPGERFSAQHQEEESDRRES